MWCFMANLVQLERGDYVLLCKKGCVIMTQKCHDDTPPAMGRNFLHLQQIWGTVATQ